MGRRRRIALSVAAALGLVLVVVLAGVLVLTQTDWGRERVRRFALEQIEGAAEGEVRIGRVEGNLLRGVRLVDVFIADAEGRPFVRADTVSTRFSLRGLLRRRLAFTDVRFVNAVIVLDKPPGEDWNWVRIFPPDPDPVVVDPDRRGWGTWIELRDVTLVASRITVRTEWEPPEDLTGAEREEALRVALSDDSRENVVPVPGGYQNVMDFRQLNAAFPLILPAHPDSAVIPIEVERFSGVVQPFRPPAALVQDLSGSFRIAEDSLFFRDVQAVLPGSRLAAEGAYALDAGDLKMRLHGAPVAFADLRWLYPPLPEEGGGTLRLALNMRSLSTHVVVEEMDLRVGEAELAGRLDLLLGDTVRLQDTDLRFRNVDTRLLERMAPEVEVPRHGALTGRLALDGPAEAMRLDGDVSFTAYGGATSRVRAAGELGVAEEIRFRDLRLRFEPLHAELVRAFMPDLPLRGTIEGYANLTGDPAGALRLESDLTLRDPRVGPSRVLAAGGIDTRDELRLQGLLLRLEPLRLDLLRDQVPQLPAGGVLTGRIRLDGVPQRALQVDGQLALTDPRSGVSRVAARGGVAMAEELRFRDLALRLEPLQLDLLREQVPALPAGATLAGPVRLSGSPADLLQVAGDLTLDDPATGVSRLAAEGGVVLGEQLAFRDLRLRADPVQVDLLRHRFPDLPAGGTLDGAVRLDGAPQRVLELAGEVTHRDPRLGVSRVAASGGIGMDEEVRFRDLDLRFSPLRLELVRGFAADLPIGGTLEGTATVDGSPAARLGFRADLAHRWGDERSQVVGGGEIVVGPEGRAAVDLRLQPLSLATVGRFAPEAGLRGSVSGRLQARGDLGDLAIDADLSVADGGEVGVSGRLDLARDEPAYDVNLRMDRFDLAALTARAPAATDLTGTASARGRGTDPATMSATIAADLVGSAVDGHAADEVRLRVALEQGLARVADARLRIGTALAEADGSFGLVAGRDGELEYRVSVDSLHAFAAWVPGSRAGVTPPEPVWVAPRPGLAGDPASEEVDAALADPRPGVERSVGLTRVQYPGVEGHESPRSEPLARDALAGVAGDTLLAAERVAEATAIPADSLAGSLRAAGTLYGNVERFGVQGTAEVEGLVVGGNAVGAGRAEYTLAEIGTPLLDVDVEARAREVRAAGMAFDSLDARLRYRGDRQGDGRLTLAAFQDEDTDLEVDAEFALALERSELGLRELSLRFDTVAWRSTQPGMVSWGEAGIEVETVELRSNVGGRIFLDGRLPADGAGDLEVVIDDLEIGHLVALAQADVEAAGRLSLEARVQGTQRSPVLQGSAALLNPVADGRVIPDVRTTFAYADRELVADAQLLHAGQELAMVEARLPIDLALVGDVPQRLLDGPLAVDVRADSIPLDAVPAFTDDVDELRGRVAGNVSVRGTFEDPILEGVVDLDLGSFRLVPVGVRFEEMAGTLRMQGDVITVDSLVAWSGGPVRIAGTIRVPELTEPVFDLALEAREAWVIDTDVSRMQLDADLEIRGPLVGMEVTGEVRTRRGVIYIPELSEFGGGEVVSLEDPGTYARIDTLFAAERAALRQDSPVLDSLRMEVAVLIDRDIWLRSREANVEIYTPVEVGPLQIRMNGGPTALSLNGTINTDRGDYEFMGRRFRLTRGAAVFGGEAELHPFIQLAAEHEVRLPGREAFSIRVVLDGYPEDLAITLESTSQPPISQSDLMSYLAFGREASSLLQLQGSGLSGQGGATGGLVGNVAALATQQLAAVAVDQAVRGLERDAARNLGLDVVRIRPADLPAELFTGRFGDVLRGTEVEVGRYIGPRFFAAGQIRPTFAQPGVRTEYRTPQGFIWTIGWQPRFLPSEPTLADQEPSRGSVFGSFLFREWRF
jgi:translocation and assembly module TamB